MWVRPRYNSVQLEGKVKAFFRQVRTSNLSGENKWGMHRKRTKGKFQKEKDKTHRQNLRNMEGKRVESRRKWAKGVVCFRTGST